MLIRASRSGTKHAGISANIEIVSNTNTFLPRPVKISYTSDRTYSSNREQEQLYRNPFISFPPFAYLLSIAKLIADTDSTDTKIFATDESFARIWKILYAIVDPTKLKTLLSGKEKEREREIYRDNWNVVRDKPFVSFIKIFDKLDIYSTKYIYIYGIIRYSKMKLEADNRARSGIISVGWSRRRRRLEEICMEGGTRKTRDIVSRREDG